MSDGCGGGGGEWGKCVCECGGWVVVIVVVSVVECVERGGDGGGETRRRRRKRDVGEEDWIVVVSEGEWRGDYGEWVCEDWGCVFERDGGLVWLLMKI